MHKARMLNAQQRVEGGKDEQNGNCRGERGSNNSHEFPNVVDRQVMAKRKEGRRNEAVDETGNGP
jgi:hypothetical protein